MKLGQIFYCVTSQGEIVKSAVSSISGADHFDFLDRSLDDQHVQGFNDPQHAIDCAQCIVREHLRLVNDAVRDSKACVLQARLDYLNDAATPAALAAQPLVMKPRFGVFRSDGQSCVVSEDEFPQTYFVPGQHVYALITPLTHYTFSAQWRPRPYFILPCVIKKTSFEPRMSSKLHYDLKDTHFSISPSRLCETIEEARTRLAQIFADETCGSIAEQDIPVFSTQHEKEADKANAKETIKSLEEIYGD